MWAEIFIIGTFWFWALIVLSACALFALIEYERVGWATITILFVLALLHFFGDFSVISHIKANPGTFALLVLGYFAVGTVWAIIKWWFFVKRLRRKYDEAKAEFLEKNGVQGMDIPSELKAKWLEQTRFLTEGRHGIHVAERPRARRHKGRILCWMTYWPWSAVWTIIDDPIKRIFREIYHYIQGLLQRIADRAYQGVEDDLTPPPEDKGGEARPAQASAPYEGRSHGKPAK
jgi:hypothetical protein